MYIWLWVVKYCNDDKCLYIIMHVHTTFGMIMEASLVMEIFCIKLIYDYSIIVAVKH